ncbi:MAG: hypothetical protein K5990_00415 [Oscillospiraceae bacterium]|nr:hypothetical protein [Oscillospiraceae bacterium]
MLPRLSIHNGPRRFQELKLSGLDLRPGAAEGSLRQTQNLSLEDAPVLRPRAPRQLLGSLTAPGGLYALDALYWVDGTTLYRDGTAAATLSTAGQKRFAALGRRLVIFPDKLLYDPAAGTVSPLERTVSTECTFADGTYAGEAAEANTILAADPSFDWASSFRPGDAVSISGAAAAENNRSLIVREIAGPALRFYEFSFTLDSVPRTLTLCRSVPDLDWLCACDNRLWGCKGDTVYASKLGDPFNWNVFDGLASDSWAVSAGSAGDFTGCCAYLGYPCFFKEEQICKVYGSRPANFELLSSATRGTAAGAGASFAVADETLFYLSRSGVAAYGGGVPTDVGAVFAGQRFSAGAAGSDGLRYYVSLRDEAGWGLYCFDPVHSLWVREDGTQALAFAFWDGALHCLDAEGRIWRFGGPAEPEEPEEPEPDGEDGDPLGGEAAPPEAETDPDAPGPETVESVAEFNDFAEGRFDRKSLTRLLLRLELEAGAELGIAVQYDSDGVWQDLIELSAPVRRSCLVPVLPRRCDHYRLRLVGRGLWRLLGLARESRIESALR